MDFFLGELHTGLKRVRAIIEKNILKGGISD